MTAQAKRILVIGMADSIHVSRWLDIAVDSTDLEVLLIPTSPHRRIHSGIAERSKSGSSGAFRIHGFLKWASLPVWALDRDFAFKGRLRAAVIARAIRTFKPDFIHVMETQNGGYPFAIAADSLTSEGVAIPKSMLTLFGSDLFWFSRFDTHLARIKRVLANVQLLSAECARDISHAQALGFNGETLPLMPVSGGLADDQIAGAESAAVFSSRKTIAIKGYGGVWGQGHLAVKALAQFPNELRGYSVEIYSAEKAVQVAAENFLKPLGIPVIIHPKFALNHSEILALYRRSRIYVGLSKSDGLPASMLEAMSQGCYPIQTASACTEGWVTDNVTAMVITNPESAELVKALGFALTETEALQAAQVKNLETIRAKYSKSALQSSSAIGYSELVSS